MDVTLCLTHACNLRCDYCYAGPKFARRMAPHTARAAVDFALARSVGQARHGGHGPECQLGFFGGEPLLEWELLKEATSWADTEASRLGVRLRKTVTTNMTLLDEERVAWLQANDFHVGLSLDGNAAMHDTLRLTPSGGPSHEACVRALRFFRGSAAKAEVIVVVDPRNVARLAESVAWLVDQDMRHLSLNPNFTAEWDAVALEHWRQAYQGVGETYVDCWRRGHGIRVNVIDGKIRARVNGGYRPCDRCGFGENEIAVSAAGHFYPCERLVGDDTREDLRIGHVDTGFFPRERRRILAARGNSVPECGDCPVRDRCMNWCGCVNYASTGFIDRVPGIVCHHEKLSIAVADRVAATLFAERNPGFLREFYGAGTEDCGMANT